MSLPDQPRYFFPKEERLCSKKIIARIFEHGQSFRVGMLKFFFLTDLTPEESILPLQVAFAVPKRSFKKAYLRNRLKRRMREAYRLQKHSLLPTLIEKEIRLVLFIKLQSRQELPYKPIAQQMSKGLLILKRKLDSHDI